MHGPSKTNDCLNREHELLLAGFFKGDARVKATTIHGFKGSEGRRINLVVGGAGGQRALSTVYVGLRRLKADPDGSRLTVVCGSHALASFGRTWPRFESLLGWQQDELFRQATTRLGAIDLKLDDSLDCILRITPSIWIKPSDNH
jgi:hypothetical protein